MMKQLIFLALAIVCGVLIIRFYTGRLTAAAQEGWQHISQSVAKDRMDSGDPVVVLDVRTEEEFSEGHIPGDVYKRQISGTTVPSGCPAACGTPPTGSSKCGIG